MHKEQERNSLHWNGFCILIAVLFSQTGAISSRQAAACPVKYDPN